MICTSLLNGEWIIGIVKWNPCGWLAGWLAGSDCQLTTDCSAYQNSLASKLSAH